LKKASVLDALSRRFAVVFVLVVLSSCASRQRQPAGAVEAVAMAPEERLGIDDVFEVRVFAEPDLSSLYRIAADGTSDYPFAGRISVMGLRSGDVQELIARKLRDGYVKHPQVSVMVKEWNSRKVSVRWNPYPGCSIATADFARGTYT